jgi:hypothetical protein
MRVFVESWWRDAYKAGKGLDGDQAVADLTEDRT